MKNELDILLDVSARLEDAGFPYMITGSMALNYYAEPRMTRDIDVVIELPRAKAGVFVRMFTPDYYVSHDAVAEGARDESMFNLIHQDSVIKVDFIVRKSDPYRQAEFERRRQITVEGSSVWIVSKEDLVLSKLVWAKDSRSEMQLRDARNIIGTGCDGAYLERWAERLGVFELLEEVRR